MMASDRSENTTKFLRLILLSFDTSLEVTKAFTQVNILPQYNGSFANFLDSNKHAIYHLWTNKTKCCIGNCQHFMDKNENSLNKKQFQKVFRLAENPVPGHCKTKVQYCACSLKANPSSLEKVDVSLLSTLIQKLGKLDPKLMPWVDTIRDVRNKLAHAESVSVFDQGRLQKWWDMLEGSIIGLAAEIPPATLYKESVERNIRLLRVSCFDVDYATSLLEQLKEENTQLQDMVIKQHYQTRNLILTTQREQTETLQRTIKDVKDEMIKLLDDNKAVLTVEIRNIVFEVVMHGLEKYLNQPKASRKDVDEDIKATHLKVDRETDALGDRCRVEWRLQQPDTWKVDQISNALMGASQMLKSWFKVEFVYVGSIIIVTSVSSLVFENMKTLVHAIRSFLQQIVSTCGLNADKPETICVDFDTVNETETSTFSNDSTLLQKDIKHDETVVEYDTDEHGIRGFSFPNSTTLENLELQKVDIKPVCDACKKKDQKYAPVEWCADCQKALCSTCSQNHKQDKHSKDHDILSYSDYQQLPPLIKNLTQTCPDHEKKYHYLCREHDQLICDTCLGTEHKNCKQAPTLKGIVRNIRTSNAFDNVTYEMDEKLKILQEIIKKLQHNLNEIQKQRKQMERHVEHTTERILTELKKLKQNMLSEIDVTVSKTKNDLIVMVEKVQNMEKGLSEIIDQKQLIKLHATNLQTYLGIKQMEKVVRETMESLTELSEKGALNNFDIRIDQTKCVEILVSKLTLFGEINVVKKIIDVTELSKHKEAQNITYTFPQQVKPLLTVNLGNGDYYSCCSLPNGIVVVTGENKQLKFIYPDGTIEPIKITGDDYIYDVSAVDENHVAVSQGNTISMINISSKKIIKSWDTDHKVRGISYRDGHIIFCAEKVGIKMLNIETGALNDVITDNDVSIDSHVAISSERICYTCPYEQKVTVLNRQHDVIIKYKDNERLQDPMGVTLDIQNNVYVTGNDSHNVLVISPDGQKVRRLLRKYDGLYYPSGIHYDTRTKQLIVITKESGVICIYSLT